MARLSTPMAKIPHAIMRDFDERFSGDNTHAMAIDPSSSCVDARLSLVHSLEGWRETFMKKLAANEMQLA